ncbi:MAG: 50S ribosomal protein L4 [Candidatus Aenigmatarchaeota archaeon]
MVKVHNVKGEEKNEVSLPEVFDEHYRPDLIKRAVHHYQSRRRQSYGADKRAGMKTSAHYEGSRHVDNSSQMMNREMSRMPREHGDTARRFRALLAPHAVGGMKAHPPKADKKFDKGLNKKERKKATRSAIASTANEEAVKERNHKFEGELPLVVEDKIESMERTNDVEEALVKLGLEEELQRAKKKKVRSGKGKNRGRKYKTKKSVLIVVGEDEGIKRAARNIPGVEVRKVDELNAELLSPGAHGSRLTVYSESALDVIEKRWER